MSDQLAADDLAAVAAQLGRQPRGLVAVAHRCRCGLPDVVTTSPRLPGGAPFPTLYYLTCPRAVSVVSRLESAGEMASMTQRLGADPALAERYRAAHHDYLRRRAELEETPEIAGVSAGGMPDRVKCLHVHLAHALAMGPGVNPFGDETAEAVGSWWDAGPCVSTEPDQGGADRPRAADSKPGPAAARRDADGPVAPGGAGASRDADRLGDACRQPHRTRGADS